MRNHRFHPVLCWVLFIWFGTSSTLLARGVVVCQDGRTGARIEWACDQNNSGECVTVCDGDSGEDDPGLPQPCQDTSIPGDESIAKVPPRPTSDGNVPIPVMVATLVLGTDAPERARAVWPGSEPQRPPDALRHIRTVVLLM